MTPINPQILMDILEEEGWLVWSCGMIGSIHKPKHLRDWTVRVVNPEGHLDHHGQPGPTGDFDPRVWRSYAGANLADALQNALDDITASKQPHPGKPSGTSLPVLDLDFMLGIKKG